MIGYALDDDPPATLNAWDGGEHSALEGFWAAVRACNPSLWVGHNVLKFDLRWLYQRSVVCGVKPGVEFPYDVSPSHRDVFDTMTGWAGWGQWVSQDVLAKALGLPGKPNDIDGSRVWQFIKDGQIERVAEYCKDDIEQSRQIYKRLCFRS